MRMWKLLIGAALVSVVSLAHAGSVVITVTTATGTCSTGCTQTVAVPDATLAAIGNAFNLDCVNAAGGPPATCTVAQGVQQWFIESRQLAYAKVYGFNVAAAQGGVAPVTGP